jgi:hypothetical protein
MIGVSVDRTIESALGYWRRDSSLAVDCSLLATGRKDAKSGAAAVGLTALVLYSRKARTSRKRSFH